MAQRPQIAEKVRTQWKEFGARVKKYRDGKALTQEELAREIGLTSGRTLENIEAGRKNMGPVSRKNFERLERGMTVAEPSQARGDNHSVPLDMAVDLKMDKSIDEQAAAIATALKCDLREATRIVMERRVKQEMGKK